METVDKTAIQKTLAEVSERVLNENSIWIGEDCSFKTLKWDKDLITGELNLNEIQKSFGLDNERVVQVCGTPIKKRTVFVAEPYPTIRL